MKMCLAPCFKGCSDEEYRGEVERVRSYFDSGGDSLFRELSLQRDSASAELQFEQASALHARLEKLKPLLSQLPELVKRIDELKAVLIQSSASAGAVNLFRVDEGCIAGPFAFFIQPVEHTRPQSMEARVEELLRTSPKAEARSALEVMEHLAILKCWYFRGTRKGEIFMADAGGTLPLRRIVREFRGFTGRNRRRWKTHPRSKIECELIAVLDLSWLSPLVSQLGALVCGTSLSPARASAHQCQSASSQFAEKCSGAECRWQDECGARGQPR